MRYVFCRQPVHLPILPHARAAYDPRTQTLYENLDAQTGDEVKVFMIISDDHGQLAI